MLKNAIIYRVRGLELESMRAQLALKTLTMPGSQDTEARGWVPEQGEFVHAIGGVWLITMGVASRILPAAVTSQRSSVTKPGAPFHHAGNSESVWYIGIYFIPCLE